MSCPLSILSWSIKKHSSMKYSFFFFPPKKKKLGQHFKLILLQFSAVVYRQSANSMRNRSCSLNSCSSDRGAKSKQTSNKSYNQVNCDQVGRLQFAVKRCYMLLYNSLIKQYTNSNSQKDFSTAQTTKTSSGDSDGRPADEKRTNSSREKLIRQFQRDFKEGQLSTRPTSIRWVQCLMRKVGLIIGR